MKTSDEQFWKKENGKLKVLTTIAMINDIVKQIGGDHVDTIPLIKGELDPHSYELVKGDDEKFSRADIIFYNGLGLEHGLSLRQNLENNPKAVAVTAQIPKAVLLRSGKQIDPHVWMDISLWMQTIDPIVEILSEKDPQHAEAYQKQALDLKECMQRADAEAFSLLQSIPSNRRYLVTSHDAFHYFTRHYLAEPSEKEWDVRCQAPEGLAPDCQLSVKDLQNIVQHIEAYQVPVLFPEANVSKDALRKILSALKEKKLNVKLCQETLYSDSMGEENYLGMVMHNVEVIARELKGAYGTSSSN